MPTSIEKFRKLLAAYEDEVQRKQHKMSKRVDPRDEVQPNWITGFLTFLRGQTVVWSPSFEVIGTFDPAARTWAWSFADPAVDWKVRTRMEEVRKQGMQWGIDLMASDQLTLADEQQAWELATVAAAVTRADGIHRLVSGDVIRFLALFDGPPASRSSTSMRAVRESQLNMPAVRLPSGPPPGQTSPTSQSSPALRRIGTPMPASSSPALRRMNTPMPSSTPAPSGWVGGSLPASQQAPLSSVRPGPEDREPTLATRTEIGQRMFEAVPYMHQPQVGVVNLLARAVAPTGPVGTVALDWKITLRPANGGADVLLAPTAPLQDALVGLWNRCRDRGAGYRFLTARMENGPSGLVTNVQLEW